MSKKALGRGLSALMEDIAPATKRPQKETTKSEAKAKSKSKSTGHSDQTADETVGVIALPIDLLMRNPDQPRRHFDKHKLDDLTVSIRDKGVLQPILVRPITTKAGKKTYQIVAGERRWHAAQAAGLHEIPVLVRDLSDREVLEVGVVENVQRADLNPIEEAFAYQALVDQFDRKQGEIADSIGKSRSHVANTLRLLGLPSTAKEYLISGRITPGHARAILASADPKGLTEAIVHDGLSVRAAEGWSKKAAKAMRADVASPPPVDADTMALEKSLSEHLGVKVKVDHKSPGGSVTLRYKTLEHLDDLISRLKST